MFLIYRSLEGHGSSVMSVKFGPTGKYLASTSGDKTMRLWNCDAWTCVRILEGHSRFVACCAFRLIWIMRCGVQL